MEYIKSSKRFLFNLLSLSLYFLHVFTSLTVV